MKDLRRVRTSRRYSESFKRHVVFEYESGRVSVSELMRTYGVCKQTVYNWVYRFSTLSETGYRVVEHKDSWMKKEREAKKRLEDLERAVGRKQIEIDYLLKLIDQAEQRHGIDIKKKSDTPRFSGFDNTEES